VKTIAELNEYALLHNISYGYDKRHNINKIERYNYCLNKLINCGLCPLPKLKED